MGSLDSTFAGLFHDAALAFFVGIVVYAVAVGVRWALLDATQRKFRNILGKALQELGTALVIAAVMLGTVEIFVKGEMIRQIRKAVDEGGAALREDALDHYLSERYGRPLAAVLHEQVAQTFQYRDHTTTGETHLIAGTTPPIVASSYSNEFTVETLPGPGHPDSELETVDFPLIQRPTGLFPDKSFRLQHVSVMALDGNGRTGPVIVDLDEQELMKHWRWINDSNGATSGEWKMTLPLKRGKSYRISIRKTYHADQADFVHITNRFLCAGMQVMWKFGPGLDPDVGIFFPDAHYFTSELVNSVDGGVLVHASIQATLLPRQGIMLQWKPRDWKTQREHKKPGS